MSAKLHFFTFFYSVFITLFNFISTINIEELKSLNYEVDILQTPIKKGEEQALPVIQMTSKYGQEYQCVLPHIEDDDTSEKETISEKNTNIKELLEPMKSGSCLLKGKDWWTYEFCFGHYIKHFHIEDGQIIGPVITIGLYDSDYNWNNETDQEKFKHVKQRYHSQFYVNGTKCDLTGQPRNAEVRLYCEEDAGDYIYRVDEPETCSYIITIHTSRLCSHPQLKPLPSKKAHSIPCHPLLNEDQYAKYLKKYNEEKELADQKRSQWLNNQQARLQIMKKENLHQIEVEELSKKESNNDKGISSEVLPTDKKKSEREIETEDPILPKSQEQKPEVDEEAVETFLFQEYDREIEKLKSMIPPEKFAAVKNSIKAHFVTILNEVKSYLGSIFNTLLKAEEDLNPLTDEASFLKLSSTLDLLSKKLDKAEKDVVEATKELNRAREAIAEATSDDTDDVSIESSEITKIEINDGKDSLVDEGTTKTFEDKHESVLDDDELHVRIRRLDRKSTDSNGKMYEMDSMQRKKLEQAVKEKLEKAGLDTGGRRIEVKIIQAGYYDNEEGKDFHTLSDAETNQFQNMIMALLTGQQEAVQEMERHKKLEENYKFTWDNNEEKDD